MKIETQNLFNFMHKPPTAVIESFMHQGMTSEQVKKFIDNAEVLVMQYMAYSRLNEYKATGVSSKRPRLQLIVGGAR